MSNTRLDAAENMFFLRQLENIEAQSYKTDYPELKYSKLLPVDENFDPGALSLVYREYTQVGAAKVISDKSKRLPRVDVYGTETATPVKPLGDSFGYSIYEIKAAAKAGVSLEQERANTARETILRLLDEIAVKGNLETGLKGFCNHSAVSSTTVATGVGGFLWSQKTAAEILVDLNRIVSIIRGQTLGLESPDTILVPELQFTQISQLRADSNTDKTVLEFFLSANPWIKEIAPLHYLSNMGTGTTTRMVAYKRDPGRLKLRNPCGYEQLPPQEEGLEFVVPCHMTTAGVIFYKPMSAYYLDSF
jgi:hypothetical protein